MESERESEVIQLELKYCERCGGLWLRRQGSVEVFCASCTTAMPEHNVARRMCSRPRLPVNRNKDMQGQSGMFCVPGGRS